jgi:hypothetical protein
MTFQTLQLAADHPFNLNLVPAKMDAMTSTVLRILGFKFKKYQPNPNFFKAKYAKGWSKQIIDECWMYLVDQNGRFRALMYYSDVRKPEHPYNAHIYALSRFHADEDILGTWSVIDRETGETLFSGAPDILTAQDWLNKNLPGWLEPDAYWSDLRPKRR